MSHWSAGQNYTGIELNLYKAPGGLILSSFEKYNVGLCGYQQMPWMANVSGVGVWSQSGSATSLGYFEVTNIYSPYVSQNKTLLVAAYVVYVFFKFLFYFISISVNIKIVTYVFS